MTIAPQKHINLNQATLVLLTENLCYNEKGEQTDLHKLQDKVQRML